MTYRRRNSRASGTETILSRTTDNLYWLSRYTKLADFVARILGDIASGGRDLQSLVQKGARGRATRL